MVDGLTLRPLGPEQIDQALPLIQALSPGVAPQEWRRFARSQTKRRGVRAGIGGVMSVQDRQGYIYGLCAYRETPSLEHGRTLEIDHVYLLNMFGTQEIAHRLIDEMARLADDAGCGAMHWILSDRKHGIGGGSNAGIATCLAERGMVAEGRQLCGPVGQMAQRVAAAGAVH